MKPFGTDKSAGQRGAMGFQKLVGFVRRIEFVSTIRGPEWRPAWVAVFSGWLVALAGCGTPGPSRVDLAAGIARTGQASIESSSSGGNHFRVFYVDGVFVAAGQVRGIYPLSPGTHTVGMEAEFPHLGLAGKTIDAGNATLTVTVAGGVRYAVTGHLLGPGVAEVKVVDLASGVQVGPSQTILMSTTAQNQNGPPPIGAALSLNRLTSRQQLELSAAALLVEALRRKYYESEPPANAWAEAPGPAVVMAVHDQMKIEAAIVMRLHRQGFSLRVEQPHQIELSRGAGETTMEFDDFLFQETPAGIRVCASRTVPGDAPQVSDGATAQMSRRNFAELKSLLEFVRKDVEG
jgi:hypothetical protein